MKKFAYVFGGGIGRVVWSGETQKTILERAANKDDKAEIQHLIDHAQIGDFISLSTGEMIFRIHD